MAKPSDRLPRVSLRPTPEELKELQGRARAACAPSLNRYLIERGLSETEGEGDRGQEEMWERAVYEIRKVSHYLKQIDAKLGRQSSAATYAKIERVLSETRAAVEAIAVALGKGESQ